MMYYLLGFTIVGVTLTLLQLVCLVLFLTRQRVKVGARAAISILKPLCGLDDGLWENLTAFATIDNADYELLLGIASINDAAYPLAQRAARTWPDRVRVVFQDKTHGVNPKVNQLISLAAAARHDIYLISDSNIRPPKNYLPEIVAYLADQSVGLVTHPVAGTGEVTLGSCLDHFHLATGVSAAMVSAKILSGHDFVVGKSMAMRRKDVARLGGFVAVVDVLAEDYVLGTMVSTVLKKRVVQARSSVENFSQHRSLGDFVSRYCRWSVLQRQAVGFTPYALQAFLHPILFALPLAIFAPRTAGALMMLKLLLDLATLKLSRGRLLPARYLCMGVCKDAIVAYAWCHGLFNNVVSWRAQRYRVLRHTRVERSTSSGHPVTVFVGGSS